MTLYDIDTETLEFLQARASRIGEELSQLWFDPFFWHSAEMHQIKLGLKKAQEYRGLMNDDISFMEVRRKGKKRQKYLVKELLGEGQLFPMLNISEHKSNYSNLTQPRFYGQLYVIGCIGQVIIPPCIDRFDLKNIEASIEPIIADRNSSLIIHNYQNQPIGYQSDDFIIRGHKGVLL